MTRLDESPLETMKPTSQARQYQGIISFLSVGLFSKRASFMPEAAYRSGPGLARNGDCLGPKPGSAAYQRRGLRQVT